jgi:hypothetical protein
LDVLKTADTAVIIMKLKVIRAVLLFCTVIGASCDTAPKLVPRPARLEFTEMIDKAELVVIGVVEGGSTVGRVVSQRGLRLQLCRVKVRIEKTLKGTEPSPQIVLFFYEAAGAWDGPAPSIISEHERAIFFLVHDGGVLRATNDMYLSHITVRTGRHPELPWPGVSLRQTIAKVLLTLGQEADIDRYTATLHSVKALAISLVGTRDTVALLQGLLGNADARVRSQACITLAEFPLEKKDCLPKLINDPEAPVEQRRQANEHGPVGSDRRAQNGLYFLQISLLVF